MKKFIGILFIALALVALVSCNSEAAHTNLNDDGTVDLKMAVYSEGQNKALSYSDHYGTGFAIASYEYTAECTTTPGAQGTQESWASLTVNNNSTTLQKMARGSWTITVRAKNSTGGVISQASIDIVLTSNGQDATINLKNFNGSTSATVSVGVTVPTLESGSVEVRYIALANMANIATQGTSVTMTDAADKVSEVSGSSVVATTTSTGNTAYTGSATMAPGLYAMQVLYKDGVTAVSGQMLAFRVADNTPFAINGTLTAGEFLDLDLTSITVDDRTITVNVTSAAAVDADDTNEIVDGTLTCTVSASSTTGTLADQVYSWYLDGILVEDQEAASFSKTGYSSMTGIHVLTCIVSGTIGGQNAVGYASSSFTANP